MGGPVGRVRDDASFMAEALDLADAGTGATYPNPCVGALVVARGRVVGRGRSGATGEAHAEVVALGEACKAARGATLYTSLEPCCHHGRTPPCTDAIVAAGVRRVVVGTLDPAPHVAGKGVTALHEAGIDVDVGIDEVGAQRVHAHYLHHVRTGRPFVTLKVATSLDGGIATSRGASQWITGEPARRHAHGERARHHAIAVGAATVIADDPSLDVRLCDGVDPVPVVFDPDLRVLERLRAKVLRTGTIVLHGDEVADDKRRAISDTGASPHAVTRAEDGLDLAAALDVLGTLNVRSLLVEGGGRLLGSFMRRGLWQRLLHYQSPLVLGEGRRAFAGFDPLALESAPRVKRLETITLEDDVLTIYSP